MPDRGVTTEIESLKYPVGHFEFEGPYTPAQRREFVELIAGTPGNLRKAVEGLSASQLDTPYRPGGWTVRQLVHHVADSHINSYVRFRLALTEETPTIKPYDEKLWAELPDARAADVETSLCLLGCLHDRWVGLMRTMTDDQWLRTIRHPERGLINLETNAALYAWHGRHHVAHVTSLRERNGW